MTPHPKPAKRKKRAPQRIARRKAIKKRRTVKRFAKRRNQAFLAFIRSQPCILAGRVMPLSVPTIGTDRRPVFRFVFSHACDGAVQACHITSRGAGGSDEPGNCYSGCAAAHSSQHQWGIQTWATRWFGSLDNLRTRAAEIGQGYPQETTK
jgi:hypothetical protein